jgi:hypothetical protein
MSTHVSELRCDRLGAVGSGGAFAVGDDQVGDVALIEAVVHALRTLRARSWGLCCVGEKQTNFRCAPRCRL